MLPSDWAAPAPQEIEELKEKYEAKLATEREAALRLKGENGIMRKKFTALQKDIEDQKDEINGLFQNKKALHEHIGSLEKDIAGLKKEIRERDETIGDKEKRARAVVLHGDPGRPGCWRPAPCLRDSAMSMTASPRGDGLSSRARLPFLAQASTT